MLVSLCVTRKSQSEEERGDRGKCSVPSRRGWKHPSSPRAIGRCSKSYPAPAPGGQVEAGEATHVFTANPMASCSLTPEDRPTPPRYKGGDKCSLGEVQEEEAGSWGQPAEAEMGRA